MVTSLKQDWIVEGVPTRVLAAGEGPAIIFVHGTGGSGKVWFNQLRRFEPTHRVIAPDLPGYGQTALPESIRSIDDYPGFVRALMDAAGIAQAVVVGNSMGGRVALQLALDHPERVAGLVLVDASGIRLPDKPIMNVRETDPRTFASMLFHQPVAIVERLLDSPEQQRARATMLRLTAPPLRRDMQERLGEIAAPTLVVWGESDRIIPREYGEAFARGIPGAELRVIPRAGHIPMLERPGAVNLAIADFLTRLEGVPA